MATRGSLDDPPLVVTTSPARTVWFIIVAVFFVAMSVYEIQLGHAGKDLWKFYATAVFFGLGIPVFIWRLLPPARLELSPGGLVWFNGRKAISYAWSDFGAFQAYRPTSRMRSYFVGFDWSPQSSKRRSLSDLTRNVTGVEGSFGGSWSLDTKTLVDILNQAKARWARQPAPPAHATFGRR